MRNLSFIIFLEVMTLTTIYMEYGINSYAFIQFTLLSTLLIIDAIQIKSLEESK